MSVESESAASRLCAACGMCCDGVLFHSVVLQPGDSARALSALGLKIKRRGGPHFLQPCSAHQDSHCAIYEQRPARCRLFNCRQLLRVATGEITEGMAFDKIREARENVHRVNSLMQRTGETNPRRALAQRYSNLMTDPPAASEAAELHTELQSAMRDLESLLEKDFRVP
jgi:Fe-S-cluster containining protein